MSPPDGATTPQHEGDGSTEGAGDLVGRVLSGRYRVESVLGEGGMGAVYLAEHTLMHKRLAVKVLHPEMTRLPEVVARFEREAMAAAHIEHPNVASATDFGKLDDGSFFLVLEYVEGVSLRDTVEAGPLEPMRALHIARQISAALARAHGLGIVHRDLKPENVMLVERDGDRDFVKVLDFGIAKVPVGQLAKGEGSGQTKALTQAGMVYGTPEYMAPEQALGQEVDARADLYALGVMLYEMLAGARPFDADSKVALLGMQVTQAPPPIATKAPAVSVPAPIEALVMRLLDKEASGRCQDAREVIDAIDAALVAAGFAYLPPQSVHGSPSSMRLRAASPVEAPPPLAPTVPPSGSSSAVAAASTRIERRRPPLPPLESLRANLPSSLANAPAAVVLTAGGSLLLVVLVVLVVAFRGSGPVVRASADGGATVITHAPIFAAKPVRASAEELSAATTPEALERLSTEYPGDVFVLRALVHAWSSQKKHGEAIAAVKKLVELDPSAAEETDVGVAVMWGAQAPETADAAFALMETTLGAKGADLLYDLSSTSGVAPKTVTRLRQALARKEVRANASPALSVALDLRDAKTCAAKHKLLAKAKEDGDARALVLIKPLVVAKGCGFLSLRDCWPCMRRDKALGEAIAAIEQRTAK